MSDDTRPEDAEDYLRGKGRKARGLLKEIGVLARMMRAMATGKYPLAPVTMSVVGGVLLYVASPIDAIPDPIPVAGFTDDMALTTGAILLLASEISEYREWEIQQENS
jgi:uncharacterized membrane protein YkvA (DUF1232 family)